MKSSQQPLVTIGIPTYNRPKGLVRSIESVLKQNYENYEIVISDNCSTDNTEEVARELVAGNPRIKYYRQEKNRGPWPNFEYVMMNATGKYFMWLADDDTLEPEVLPGYVQFLEENADYSLVMGTINYYDNGKLETIEEGFTIEEKSRLARVNKFYDLVEHGALFYGLIPTSIAQSVPLRNVLGGDWHYVAALAYIGKIKNFEYSGYNKNKGGTSVNWENYARIIGASSFAENFPFLDIASVAFKEIWSDNLHYRNSNKPARFKAGILAFMAVFKRFYLRPLRTNPSKVIKREWRSLKKYRVSFKNASMA